MFLPGPDKPALANCPINCHGGSWGGFRVDLLIPREKSLFVSQ